MLRLTKCPAADSQPSSSRRRTKAWQKLGFAMSPTDNIEKDFACPFACVVSPSQDHAETNNHAHSHSGTI